MNWVATHIHYDFDHFDYPNALNRVIGSIVTEVTKEFSIEKYFFINYNENGTHFRLRFLTNEPIELRKFIQNEIETIIEKFPSEKGNVKWDQNSPSLKENNTYFFDDYEKEVDRYLGKTNLDICESQFCLSSKCSLAYFRTLEKVSSAGQLKTMMQMQISLLTAFELEDKLSFYEYQYKHWLPSIVSSKEEVKRLVEDYHHIYLKQRVTISKMINAISKQILENGDFAESWFNEWITGNKSLYKELIQNSFLDYQLHPSFKLANLAPDKYDRGEENRYSICDSLIHMNNNRLGASNQAEVMVQYLLMRHFQEN